MERRCGDEWKREGWSRGVVQVEVGEEVLVEALNRPERWRKGRRDKLGEDGGGWRVAVKRRRGVARAKLCFASPAAG